METVAAISTPVAAGGISVIRISGDGAIKTAKKIFSPANKNKDIEKMKGYTACYGKVHNGENELDDGVLLIFRAPHSYTGEDVAEISVHGGIYTSREVLRAVLENGARPAEAGEFTKRAFLNGKLSLTQAEAVIDIIEANGKQLHRAAISARDGELHRKIEDACEKIVSVCADISAWIDYPEEDLPELKEDVLFEKLSEVKDELNSLVSGYDTGKMLREGISTAIVGKPNAGKSTLMNLLSRANRSIVTDIAGTTRDIIEEKVRLDEDIILCLADTAGIRETSDEIEEMGVILARKKIKESDIVLAVFDLSKPLSAEDEEIIASLSDSNTVAVFNKSDEEKALCEDIIKNKFSDTVTVSAKNGDGAEELCTAIRRKIKKTGVDLSAPLLVNERQRTCLIRALNGINGAINALNTGITLDAVGAMLDEAANELLILSGKKATDSVVAEVFSRFCVGK